MKKCTALLGNAGPISGEGVHLNLNFGFKLLASFCRFVQGLNNYMQSGNEFSLTALKHPKDLSSGDEEAFQQSDELKEKGMMGTDPRSVNETELVYHSKEVVTLLVENNH